VTIALAVNLLIAASKLVVGIASGSAALLAEAAHSVADSVNEVFLLAAVTRSARRADTRHPFGYGKERYFWSMLAAVGIFVTGSCFSFYQALGTFLRPDEAALEAPKAAFGVLLVALVAEASSLSRAVLQVRGEALATGALAAQALRAAVTGHGDPALRTVLAEDATAVVGVVAALTGLALHVATGHPQYEGLAALTIAALLAWTAYRLGTDAKAQLIGQSASVDLQVQALDFLQSQPEIDVVLDVLTMRLGSTSSLLAARVDLADGLDSDRVEAVSGRIKDNLAHELPYFSHVFLDITDATAEGAAEAERRWRRLRRTAQSLSD
jgi:cation diffusion facilitator family transporter